MLGLFNTLTVVVVAAASYAINYRFLPTGCSSILLAVIMRVVVVGTDRLAMRRRLRGGKVFFQCYSWC